MDMRGPTYPRAANPFVQIASLLVFAVLMIGAVFVGAVILSLLLGAGALLALILSIRSWWLRRRLRETGRRPGPPEGGARPGQVIDVSYTVVEERAERRSRGRSDGTTHDS
jgi:membrane protein implicated in regulation of membrane protease activity